MPSLPFAPIMTAAMLFASSSLGIAAEKDESDSLRGLPRLILPDASEDLERLGIKKVAVTPQLVLRLKPRRTLIGNLHLDEIEAALTKSRRCTRGKTELTISFEEVEWTGGAEISQDLPFFDTYERSDTLRRDLQIEYRALFRFSHPGGEISTFQHDLDLEQEFVEVDSPVTGLSKVIIDPTTLNWRKTETSTSRREISKITIELSQTPPERYANEFEPRAYHVEFDAATAPESEIGWLIWKPAHFTGKPLVLARIAYEKANGDRLAWLSENFHRDTEKTLSLGLREALWTAKEIQSLP